MMTAVKQRAELYDDWASLVTETLEAKLEKKKGKQARANKNNKTLKNHTSGKHNHQNIVAGRDEQLCLLFFVRCSYSSSTASLTRTAAPKRPSRGSKNTFCGL